VTTDPRETVRLFQRLSVALQRFDASCLADTFTISQSAPWPLQIYYILKTIDNIASEEVITQIIRTKCMPVLLYGLEACPLRKSDINSLNFVVNRFFVKLFRTTNNDIVNLLSCKI